MISPNPKRHGGEKKRSGVGMLSLIQLSLTAGSLSDEKGSSFKSRRSKISRYDLFGMLKGGQGDVREE